VTADTGLTAGEAEDWPGTALAEWQQQGKALVPAGAGLPSRLLLGSGTRTPTRARKV